jgi:hypothetical protein
MFPLRANRAALVGVVLLLALVGCVNAPAGAPTPLPTASRPSPTASPIPTTPSTDLVEMRMTAGGLTLIGASGNQLGFLGFDDDPAASVSRLTEALKTPPLTEEPYRLVGSGTPTTVYRWGGFLLHVAQDPNLPEEHAMGADFVGPVFGEIRLVGPGGVSVGDAVSELPEPISLGSYEGDPNGPRYLLGDPVPVTKHSFAYDRYVQGFDDPASGTLVELIAPVASYGGPIWRRFAQTP